MIAIHFPAPPDFGGGVVKLVLLPVKASPVDAASAAASEESHNHREVPTHPPAAHRNRHPVACALPYQTRGWRTLPNPMTDEKKPETESRGRRRSRHVGDGDGDGVGDGDGHTNRRDPNVADPKAHVGAPWVQPLVRFDVWWTKWEARITTGVLGAEIVALVTWVALKGMSAEYQPATSADPRSSRRRVGRDFSRDHRRGDFGNRSALRAASERRH